MEVDYNPYRFFHREDRWFYMPKQGKHVRTSAPWATLKRLLPSLLAFIAAALLCFIALEVPSNTEFYLIPPLSIVFCVAVIACCLATLYFLGQQHVLFAMMGAVVFCLLGIVEYFVLQFKGAPILPGDVFVAGTAFDVAGQYRFDVPTSGWVGIGCGLAAIAVLGLMQFARRQARTSSKHRLRDIGAGILCAALACGLVLASAATNFLGVGINYFSADKAYREHGFIPTFIRAANDIRLVAPEGYSDQAAEQLEGDLATTFDANINEAYLAASKQFSELQPSVVIIMNESYSDLSLFENLHDGYDGTWLTTTTIDGALAQGWLSVPVIGGGTADVEFEALCGISLGILGSGKHPYPQFDFSTSENLARYFGELGYHTSAMHPAAATNYRRVSVYPQMGFEDTYFDDSFPSAQRWHGWVDDGDTYDKILEILQDESAPQFIFDVTVQNHGGYDKGHTPTAKPEGYTADWLNDEDNAKMNDFLACIERSDRYLQVFLEQLKNLERPVVVLFFGDHQPRMAEYFNDDLFEDEDELEHFARITKTPYLMWANYPVAGTDKTEIERNTSSTYLGPNLLKAIGAPLTNYHKSLLQTEPDVAAIGTASFLGGDGTWYRYSDVSPYQEHIERLHILQFYEFP